MRSSTINRRCTQVTQY